MARLARWFSTHPSTEERVERLRSLDVVRGQPRGMYRSPLLGK
jgi:predicted Zn-dependent protease